MNQGRPAGFDAYQGRVGLVPTDAPWVSRPGVAGFSQVVQVFVHRHGAIEE